jgi:hypothetical protein
METTKTNYNKEMHKIVWILLGVFGLIAVSFPTALWRVSQMEKFKGFHVKSYPLEGKVQHIADKKP